MGNKVQITIETLSKVDAGLNEIKAKFSSAINGIKSSWMEIAAVAGTAYSAWNLMEIGAKAEQAEESFRAVASSFKESADQMISDMKRVSSGTIDDSDLMQKSVQGMIMGLKGEQITQLLDASRLAARTWGQDVSSTFDTVVTAVGGGVRAMGPLVRMGLVTKEQFELLNKAMAAGVTDIDLFSLVMANAEKQTAAFGGKIKDSREELQQLKAEVREITEVIGKLIYKGLAAGANISESLQAVVIAPVALIEKGLNQIGIGGNKWQSALDYRVKKSTEYYNKMMGISDVSQKAGSNLGAADEKIKGIMDKAQAGVDAEKNKTAKGKAIDEEIQKRQAYYSSVEEYDNQLQETHLQNLEKIARQNEKDEADDIKRKEENAARYKAMQEGEISLQLFKIDLIEQEQGISEETTEQKISLNKRLMEIQEQNLLLIDQATDPSGWYAQADAIEATRGKLIGLNKTLEEYTGTLGGGFAKGIKTWLADVDTAFESGVKLAQGAAQAMSAAFEDFFFDVFEGRAKNFKEYFRSFVTSIEKMIAKMLAEKTTAAIIGAVADLAIGAATSSSSTSTSTSTSSGQGSSLYQSGNSGWNTHHKGGLIMHQGGYIPRFHAGGLSSDERPAILQTGEYVVSRRGVAALDRINGGEAGQPNVNIIVNVENKSSQPVNAKQGQSKFDGKQFVVGVILEDFSSYGPVFNAVRSVR